MKIRECTLDDVGLLTGIRLDFIAMVGIKLPDQKERMIRIQLDKYFRKHIPFGDFIAYVAMDGQQVMAAAFMVIGERPAGVSFITGITGTVMNVVTYPEYRNKGYATLLVEALIGKAKELGATAIDLNATLMGKKIYAKLGFVPVEDTAMRLSL